MISLEEKFRFLVHGAEPTGAKMSLPEENIRLELDSGGLRLRQDVPSDDGETFLRTVQNAAATATEMIQPGSIFYAGFAASFYQHFPSEDQVFEASLRIGSTKGDELADRLGMNRLLQEFSHTFTSGTYDLQVKCKPAILSVAKRENEHLEAFRIPVSQKERNVRMNASIESLNLPTGYVMLLEADLREWNPPSAGLANQFAEFRKWLDILKKEF